MRKKLEDREVRMPAQQTLITMFHNDDLGEWKSPGICFLFLGKKMFEAKKSLGAQKTLTCFRCNHLMEYRPIKN